MRRQSTSRSAPERSAVAYMSLGGYGADSDTDRPLLGTLTLSN